MHKKLDTIFMPIEHVKYAPKLTFIHFIGTENFVVRIIEHCVSSLSIW